LERALSRNEQVKGKIEVYSQFRQELISDLGKIYPELITHYKQIRKEE
jgi:mediator of RNA polymerase II transcription subunit 10